MRSITMTVPKRRLKVIIGVVMGMILLAPKQGLINYAKGYKIPTILA
jgi:hypothetical protein